MSTPLPRTFMASTAVLSSLFVVLPFLSAGSAPPGARRTAAPAGAVLVAPIAAHPVSPTVREIAVTPVGQSAARLGAATRSRPVPSTGFGVVGVTWTGAAPRDLRVAVRTRDGRTWSSWTSLPVDVVEHGPDPRSVEGRGARPGTDPLVVGDVDLVQLRVSSRTSRTPDGLRLSLVDPGLSPADDDPVREESTAIAARLAPLGVAPRPRIRSRAAWGANERLRTRRPTYGVVRAGFVHHTVNSNGYSRADVPAIIRGIYAFHTQSRGWSDIGYNFLVDRFGRIWEGRFGGVARNVIGAHTLGFNHLSFAMSAIGNFQVRRPPAAVVRAFGQLMAWKLGINGVSAGDRRQRLRGRLLHAVNGHRDAGRTACPGIHLYRRVPEIRRLALALQRGGVPPVPPPEPTPAPPPTEDDGGPGPG